jgi:recombinational DNA repair ATPase RecF
MEKELREQISKDIQRYATTYGLDRRDLTMLLQAQKIAELGYDGYKNWVADINAKSNARINERLKDSPTWQKYLEENANG